MANDVTKSGRKISSDYGHTGYASVKGKLHIKPGKPDPKAGPQHADILKGKRSARQLQQMGGNAAAAIRSSASRFGSFVAKTVTTAEQAMGVLRSLYAQSPSRAAEELQKMAFAILEPNKQGA